METSVNTTPGTDRPKVEQVKEQAKDTAVRLSEQARSRLKDQFAGQKEKAAENLGSVSDALRQTGQQMREQQHPVVAQGAEKAAEYVDRMTGYLQSHNVDQMIGDMEQFARRRPGVFVGGAFLLGFMATRFLKSSGGPRQSGPTEGYQPYSAYEGSLQTPVPATGVEQPYGYPGGYGQSSGMAPDAYSRPAGENLAAESPVLESEDETAFGTSPGMRPSDV